MNFKAEYEKVVKRDQDSRDAAYLELTTSVCGVEIRQMTLADLIVLDGLPETQAVFAGVAFRECLLAFLWRLSPRYRPGWLAAFLFARKHRKIDFAEARKRITDYVADTFNDSPGGSADDGSPPPASFATFIMDRIATEYGWSKKEIMRSPLKVLFQQIKLIRAKENPDCNLRSRRVLKLFGDRLRLKQAQLDLVNALAKRATN